MFRALAFVFSFLVMSAASISWADSNSVPDRAIRLGVTAPLTGDFAGYTQTIREGVELARKDLARQGIATEVFYEDACLPAQAVSAIRKLIDVNKIDALAANYCLLAVPPMSRDIEAAKLPSFHTACTSDNILSAGDYIFSTNIKGRNEARRLAEYAHETLGARTASILYLTTDFGEDYNRHFTQRFEELGGRVLSSDTSPIGTNDFKSELTKARRQKPDVLFAAHIGNTLGVLIKQARELGLHQQILAIYEAEDPSVLRLAGAAAEGLLFFVPEPQKITASVAAFQTEFSGEYGHAPLILASNAYDATLLLGQILKRCNLDRECSKREIYKIKDYDGASGIFSIDADGGTTKGFVLKTVRNGAFQRVE